MLPAPPLPILPNFSAHPWGVVIGGILGLLVAWLLLRRPWRRTRR